MVRNEIEGVITRTAAEVGSRAAERWEEAVVLSLREEAQGGDGHRQEEVRNLSAEVPKLRDAVGWR
jgi:hypothetical protein